MALPPALSAEARERLTSVLLPGERLRWAGQPRPSSQWASFGIWLFAIPWTAFALFWESLALIPLLGSLRGESADLPAGFSIVFPLFGLPFVIVGLCMMAVPFVAIGKAGKTVHAVTDRRLLTVTDGRSLKVESAFIDRIGPVERTSRSDGSGSIRIQTLSRIDSDGDRVTERLTWTGIPDVLTVERLILEAQASPSA